jgi:multidrug efflux system membrane fusion protein
MVLVSVLVIALVWWGLYEWVFKPKPRTEPPPVPVATAPVTSGDVPIYLTGLGTVQAFNTVTIHSHIDGTLDRVAFVEGQDVKAGDLLAEIDPRPLRAQLEQATAAKGRDEATLANAKVDLARYQQLVAEDSIARQQLDTQAALVRQDTATVANDQAAIDYATVQLGYTRITSPISGRTGVRLLDAGNIIHAADAEGLVVVTQIEPITVLFTLPGDDFGMVSQQMKAGHLAITVTAHPSNQDGGNSGGAAPADAKPLATGTLMMMNNQIDQTTGTIQLKAVFPNRDHALWPGLFVNARLLLQTLHDAVTMPSAALQRGPDGTFVYVVDPDGTARIRAVTVSSADTGGPTTLIQSGLNAGEQVVVDGQLKLHNGTRVTTAQPGALPQGAQPGATPGTSQRSAVQPGGAAQPRPRQGAQPGSQQKAATQ